MSTVQSLPRTKNGASQQALNQRWASYRTKSLKKYAAKKIQEKKQKINPTSSLREKQNKVYSILRIDFLQHNRICRARYAGCKHYATEIHHMLSRAGWWLLVMKFFFPICKPCHQQVTKNSKEAIEKGISISRNQPLGLDFNKHTIAVMKKFNLSPPNK